MDNSGSTSDGNEDNHRLESQETELLGEQKNTNSGLNDYDDDEKDEGEKEDDEEEEETELLVGQQDLDMDDDDDEWMAMCGEEYEKDEIGPKSENKVITLTGTVISASTPRLLNYAKSYICSQCKQKMWVEGIQSRYNNFPKYVTCSNLCLNGRVNLEKETDTNSSTINKYRDYQEINIQEMTYNLRFGAMPKITTIILEEDLINSCRPGDDVIITGTSFRRWEFRKGSGKQMDIDKVLQASNIEVTNDESVLLSIPEEMKEEFETFWKNHKDDPFKARNFIISSFCPQIYGLYVVKLAMCVIITGGVQKATKGDGKTNVRGEAHLLLVGDPGTGKSQLMKYVSKISPRGMMTTGIGTTSAGLTVSAVKDGNGWQLEAGALVLANGGICCIDEFSCMKEHDRVNIHEAMEQQTISIAKAGIVCSLPSRCSIIASTNPKGGRYRPNESLDVNLGIPTPLLSRFDLLIILQDVPNNSWDMLMCDYLLSGMDPTNRILSRDSTIDLWSTEKLKAYLYLAKNKRPVLHKPVKAEAEGGERKREITDIPEHLLCFLCKGLFNDPVSAPCCKKSFCDICISSEFTDDCPNCHEILDSGSLCKNLLLQEEVNQFNNPPDPRKKDAFKILSKYYQLQRENPRRDVSRTTFRLQESLIRLAEGHAKLMFRDEVLIHDAIVSVCLVESTMVGEAALIGGADVIHSNFPESPKAEYAAQAKCILELLDLKELWEYEKEVYSL